MGDTGYEMECAGRGDETRCPNGEVLTIDAGIKVYRCDDCREHYRIRAAEQRLEKDDDGLTRPMGDPGEAGHGSAA